MRFNRGILEHHDVRCAVVYVERLELIAPRQILVIVIPIILVGGFRSLGGDGWSSSGRDGVRLVAGGRWNDNCASNAENFANVDVAAFSVGLGVVLVKDSGVHVVSGSDGITGIIGNHGVNGGTVLTLVPQADLLVGNEVGALIVDDAIVNNSQLVRRDTLGG